MRKDQKKELERTGRIWFRKALEESTLCQMTKLTEIGDSPGARPDWTDELDEIFGTGSRVCDLVQTILCAARPVRLVVFNKTTATNWAVPWHQDRVIAVRDRHELDGYSCWSRKTSYWHVEPPVSLLQKMIFIRIHLDPCDQSNGALELALASHTIGKIAAEDAAEIAKRSESETCIAARGDVLLAKALTLHRSQASVLKVPRRAIRVDYADPELLYPELKWHWPV